MSKFFGFKTKERFMRAIEKDKVMISYKYAIYDIIHDDDKYKLVPEYIPSLDANPNYNMYSAAESTPEMLMQNAIMFDGVSLEEAAMSENTTKYLWYDSKEEFIEEIEAMEFSFSYKTSSYLFTLDGRGYNCIPEYLDGVQISDDDTEVKLTVSAPTPQELIDKVVMTDGVTLNEVLEMDVNDTFEDRYTD